MQGGSSEVAQLAGRKGEASRLWILNSARFRPTGLPGESHSHSSPSKTQTKVSLSGVLTVRGSC